LQGREGNLGALWVPSRPCIALIGFAIKSLGYSSP
jgi:hypothetical protein